MVTVRNTINGLFFSNNQTLPVLLLLLYIEEDYIIERSEEGVSLKCSLPTVGFSFPIP